MTVFTLFVALCFKSIICICQGTFLTFGLIFLLIMVQNCTNFSMFFMTVVISARDLCYFINYSIHCCVMLKGICVLNFIVVKFTNYCHAVFSDICIITDSIIVCIYKQCLSILSFTASMKKGILPVESRTQQFSKAHVLGDR